MQNKSLPPISPVLLSVTQRSSLEKSSTSNFIVLLIFIDLTDCVLLDIIRNKNAVESTKQSTIRRSLSMSDSKTKSYLNNKSEKIPLENRSNNIAKEKTVNVPMMIDDDFDKFFGNSTQKFQDNQIDDLDFDHLKPSRSDL